MSIVVFYIILYTHGGTNLSSKVTIEHPLNWRDRMNRWYPGQYKLEDWREITEQEYDNYNEKGSLVC